MATYHPQLAELVQRDPRYAYEAYEFMFAAMAHAHRQQDQLNPSSNPDDKAETERHVTGRELLLGVRELAVQEFGLMAPVVFRLWGVRSTSDFGEIVFNLVQEGLIGKADHESREDFRDVFDLDHDLTQDFRIDLKEAEWTS